MKLIKWYNGIGYKFSLKLNYYRSIGGNSYVWNGECWGKEIFKRYINDDPLDNISSVVSKEEIIEARMICKKVFVHEDVQDYILKIVNKTLNNNNIILGVSPRGSLAMLKTAQVYAALQGREFVTPDDIKKLVPYVFSHRIVLKNSMRVKNISNNFILEEILSEVETPVEEWGNSIGIK